MKLKIPKFFVPTWMSLAVYFFIFGIFLITLGWHTLDASWNLMNIASINHEPYSNYIDCNSFGCQSVIEAYNSGVFLFLNGITMIIFGFCMMLGIRFASFINVSSKEREDKNVKNFY